MRVQSVPSVPGASPSGMKGSVGLSYLQTCFTSTAHVLRSVVIVSALFCTSLGTWDAHLPLAPGLARSKIEAFERRLLPRLAVL